MLYAKLIGRIALFTCENIAHVEFYLQSLLPKILATYTINNYTVIQHVKQILDDFVVSAVSSQNLAGKRAKSQVLFLPTASQFFFRSYFLPVLYQ